ncbi:hypothetical protein EGI20_17585, partial [Aquitalea sp. S1-19]|nr:hypothetical protein [Aquitalea sp. S1-19]
NVLLSRPVTATDLSNGVNVEVPVAAGQSSVKVTAQVTDVAGNASAEVQDTAGVDNVAPTVANTTISYAENQAAGAELGNIGAADGKGVTGIGFKWADGSLHATSQDGFYSIDGNGRVSLTPLGAASASGVNDFETGPNSGNYVVVVSDAAGNKLETTITLKETNVSEAPTTSGGYAAGSEDAAFVLQWSQFNASDVDASSSLSIKITSLPADGKLQLNGIDVTQAQLNAGLTISKADIDAGKLQFKPDLHESSTTAGNGSGSSVGNKAGDYASFNYQVSDGTSLSTTGKFVVDIAADADAPNLSLGNPVPTLSEGLLLERWNNLNLSSNGGDGINPDTLEAAIEAAGTPSTSGVQQDAAIDTSSNSITSRLSGLIYLEAGKTYTFSGTADDSFRLEIGGETVATATWAGVGQNQTYTGTFTAKGNGWYTLTAFHDNEAGPGSASINIASGGGTGKPLNSTNFDVVTDAGKLSGLVNLGGYVENGSKEGGYYPQHPLNTGLEDSWILLSSFSAALKDTDGSESLSLSMSGLPVGAQLKDAAGNTVTVGVGGVVSLNGLNLSSLQFKGPQDWNGSVKLTVTATATESSNGDKESTSQELTVTVLPVTDAPVVVSGSAVVSEEGLSGGLADTVGTPNDQSDSKTANGKLAISDADKDALSVVLTAPAGNLYSGGQLVSWSGNSSQTLTAKVGAVTVATITIDNNGNYTVTLNNDKP